jgi:hypothetical protein
MLRKAALWFGIVFLAIGVLGFVPGITSDGKLLGIFEVNAFHNIVHLLSGAAALACYYAGDRASRMYFQIFGPVYGLVALAGIFTGDGDILGILANNWPDVVLHLLIAGAAIYLGYFLKPREAATTAPQA